MQITVIPLGVSSAMPAHGRHLSSTALVREGRILLFDCGEGTQYQMARAGLKKSRIDVICLTHLHGDHFFGLMGLLATMSMQQRSDPLIIVGPEGVQQSVLALMDQGGHFTSFPVEFKELSEDFSQGIVYTHPNYRVEAHVLNHRTFAVGYRYQEKDWPGRINAERARALGIQEPHQFKALREGENVTLGNGKVIETEKVVGPKRPGASFAYVTDTEPCVGGVRLARGTSLMYHEATFMDDMRERARETGHSTAREAGQVADEAETQRLLLGHFSARYADPTLLAKEAQTVFAKTEAAQELTSYTIPAYLDQASAAEEENDREHT